MSRSPLRALFGSSLQRRLVLALLAILLLGGAAASLGLYVVAMRQQGEIFDERLRALSFNLPVEAMLEMPRGANDASADGIVVQVWRTDGTLLWTSEAQPAPISTQIGMADVEYGDERWRSFTRVVLSSGLVLQPRLAEPWKTMPVIQRAFCLTACSKVSGKCSRTQITRLVALLRPKPSSRNGESVRSRTLKRANTSLIPFCLRRKPMS